MHYHPRSSWTASLPASGTMAESYIGMPYFTESPSEIEFYPVGLPILYAHRNPVTELETLRKASISNTGLPDLDYNYAIAQNVPGVYVIRGGLTKCNGTEGTLKVLMLLGKNERPTDLLKENQLAVQALQNKPPVGLLKPGDRSVHVFDLIEYLSEKGFYSSRNDGIYSSFTEQAVKLLQVSEVTPNQDGVYDITTSNRLRRNLAKANS